MNDSSRRVTDRQGVQARLLSEPDAADSPVMVQTEEGREVRIERDRLEPQEEGGYFYRGSFDPVELDEETVEERRIPLARETAEVHRESRETGRVRITKRVRDHEETIDEPVLEETVSVERVPVDRVVQEPPSTRQEGDTIIIPRVEERLVLTKELVVTEEVHVTKHRTERRDQRTVSLKHEEVDIEREESEPGSQTED